MIRLTRLRQTDPLYLNPDHIERLEHHHETVVRLLNGNEYVVCESPDEIVDQVVMLRARSIALAARLAADDLDARVGTMSHEVSLAAGTTPLPEVSTTHPDRPAVRPPDAEG
ncbi:MAG: flagellar FlbD family protein [Acidimicrobiales bacterium]|nr:flagellar FlbD family protein [Acidimicrobiales bacterium]MCB9392750.1 flagellar FlbD family protein [Acidimicrobiaceae bacterium]